MEVGVLLVGWLVRGWAGRLGNARRPSHAVIKHIDDQKLSPNHLTPPQPSQPTLTQTSVKDSAEKDAFFKRLPSLLPAIPGPVAVRKLLPLLANALEFGGAPASAVGSLLQIGKPLEPEDFVKRVVPCLAKLFASTDRNLRRNLLESVDLWGPHLTQVRFFVGACVCRVRLAWVR